MTRKPFGRGESLLMLPAFLLLTLGFLVPILWFFVEALTDLHGPAEILARAVAVITSQALINALVTTNWIALLVTLCTLAIGYPMAYVLTQTGGARFSIIIFCIVVPHFTSIVVRTYSWMVLLGRNGLINQLLRAIGLTAAPLPLLYNRTSIVIGMVYVLLPYMILTLYAAMKGIEPSLLRAAKSLGGSNAYVFCHVYLPLSRHAIVSGSLIVFIMSIGFFITPALMGGSSDIMIAMLIEHAVEGTFNWPDAAFMSLVLLTLTLVLYAIYYRVTDLRRLLQS